MDHLNLLVSKHDMFKCSAFLQYQTELAAYLQVAEPTIHAQIEAIQPLIAQEMTKVSVTMSDMQHDLVGKAENLTRHVEN